MTTGTTDRTEVFDTFAGVLKALANGRRLELIEVLAQGEHTVDTLATMTDSAVTTTSNHLQALKRAGLVATRREGTSIHYRLAGDDVVALFVAAKQVAVRRSPALATALTDYLGDTAEDAGEDAASSAGLGADTLVIDVRPAEEYAAGHLPGAVSIPFPEFADRIDEVPADRPVALYCRGELCRRAREAASLLRSNGVDARAMESGVVEWRAAGNWPVSPSGHGATGATSTD